MKRVLVYSIGRVGSLSVKRALEQADIPVTHCHYTISSGEHRKTALNLGDFTHVITLVRDPLERNISEFFRRIDVRREWAGEELVKSFLRDFNHMWPFVWWDWEFNRTFNFNIFEQSFNKNTGFTMYHPYGGRPEILIMHTKALNIFGESVIGNLLAEPNLKIGHVSNTDEDKQRQPLKKKFLEIFRPSVAFLKHYYDSYQATKHWFNPIHRNEMFDRWHRIV